MAKTKTSVRAAKKLLHFATAAAVAKPKHVAKEKKKVTHRDLALKTKAALANGFRNFLISKGLASYVNKRLYGMPSFELMHVGNIKGVYTYSPEKSGDFCVTQADVIDNISPDCAFDTSKVAIATFSDISVRVRDGSGGCATQVNVNPRVKLVITTDGVRKTARLCHTDTRIV
jgi:hypothetical protein